MFTFLSKIFGNFLGEKNNERACRMYGTNFVSLSFIYLRYEIQFDVYRDIKISRNCPRDTLNEIYLDYLYVPDKKKRKKKGCNSGAARRVSLEI